MACNCGKRKAPQGAQSQSKKAAARPTVAKMPPPAGSGKQQSYTLQTADGRTMTFGSRLERDAARVRSERGL